MEDVTYKSNLNDVLDEIGEMLIKKHHDYGVDNLKRHGLFGIIVRMDDKLARLANLSKSTEIKVEDECLKDTLRDIAGYAIQAILLLDKKI